VAAALCIVVSCSDQPKTKCTVGRGQFAAAYKPLSPLTDGGACVRTGEVLGVEMYNQSNADKSSIDVNKGTVWIKGQSMVEAITENGGIDPNPAHQQNSIGDFGTSVPGSDTFCDVPALNPAEQDFPASDAGVPSTLKVKYEWSHVRVVVSPQALGTQLVADLNYTRNDTTGDCTAAYHVTALYPHVDCSIQGLPTFCKCLPYADPNPDHERPRGSGISPDLFGPSAFGDPEACMNSAAEAAAIEQDSKVTCDRITSLCVLKGDPPQ